MIRFSSRPISSEPRRMWQIQIAGVDVDILTTRCLLRSFFARAGKVKDVDPARSNALGTPCGCFSWALDAESRMVAAVSWSQCRRVSRPLDRLGTPSTSLDKSRHSVLEGHNAAIRARTRRGESAAARSRDAATVVARKDASSGGEFSGCRYARQHLGGVAHDGSHPGADSRIGPHTRAS